MNWGEMLLGKEVAPGGGWVVRDTRTGGWLLCPPSSDGFYLHFNVYQSVPDCAVTLHTYSGHACKPVYPPKGWAGASEAEIWRAVFPDGCEIPIGDGEEAVHMQRNGAWSLESAASEWDTGSPAALILALQNAQVLAKRLQEAQQ